MNILNKNLIALYLLLVTVVTHADSVFENSEEAPFLNAIQNSKLSIDLEIYSMQDEAVINELKKAALRGVRVRIVHEPTPVGDSCRVFNPASSTDTPECARGKKLVNFINENGGSYVPFDKKLCGNPNPSCLQHGKLLIIDRKSAFISTGNLDPTSLCDSLANPKKCNRDYTFLVDTQAVVTDLLRVFENDHQAKPTDLSSLNTRLTVSPDSMKPLLTFIASAKESLLIENQYLNNSTFNQAVIEAAKRGVQVSVLVASACSFGKPSTSDAKKWKDTYSQFENAQIKSWMFTRRIVVGGRPGYLHAKAIIVDGKKAWVGSVNGSTAALTNNREFGIFVTEPALISKLSKSILSDFSDPRGESWVDSVECKYDN